MTWAHTYCTDLEAAGVSINVAKYLMGHISITLTTKIYSHMREDILTEAAQKLDLSGATQNPVIRGISEGNPEPPKSREIPNHPKAQEAH
ncbi:hypothetical protein D7X33_22130 [Butyricicoccus sp. 1XD8-22]|nr:hypothetical protein D7X33_22130 [Butyricicoccus sp. 1XD8-22]